MTSAVDGGPVRARAGRAWPAVAGLLLLATLAPEPAHAQTGICGRTEVVRDALVALVAGVSDCALVTDTHLAAITGELDLEGEEGVPKITALAAGDFDGLTSLERLTLTANALTTLPAGVFDGLTSLSDAVAGPQRSDRASRRGVRRADLAGKAESGVQQRSDHASRPGVRRTDRADGLYSCGTQHWAELPDGVFDELTSLRQLWLQQNNDLTAAS